jgi:hypothetical protein
VADHNDRTPQIPGQRQEHTDHDQTADFPRLSRPSPEGKNPRLPALREWWEAAWRDGGFLHERWEDLGRAPELGWQGMAPWIRAMLMTAGVSFVVLLAEAAGEVVLQALHQTFAAVPKVQIGVDTSSGVAAVVDQPVRTYIAQHSAGLPVDGSTVYTIWQIVGLVGLVGGFFRSSGARLTWTAWGAASIAMVYSTAPADGRTIATGLAVLAWTAASAFALRGLTLRPSLLIHNAAPGIELRPEIHVSAPASPPAEDTPENVHPLQKR